ncbi:MAG: hypothetical protein ACLUFB_09965 [Ruminococcus sp.]
MAFEQEKSSNFTTWIFVPEQNDFPQRRPVRLLQLSAAGEVFRVFLSLP